MFNRRNFLRSSFFSGLGIFIGKPMFAIAEKKVLGNPVVLSTWDVNIKANEAAWEILRTNGTALDAVEAGVQVPEADPKDQSVGYGGLPDRDGHVTLDACIMDEKGNCGSVMAVEGIMHVIKLARLVMEKTPHVQLSGEGAVQFALANGFIQQNLLTTESEAAWKEWQKKAAYDPMTIPKLLEKNNQPGQLNNHDTIGMIAMDANGNISGACSTSGMAYKMKGRVGDSPIIGAGLFVDNETGAATSSGVGEEVIRICGSHTVVELMRQGYHPEDACKKTLQRLVKLRGSKVTNLQVGFIALSNKGHFGSYALQPGFSYAVQTSSGVKQYKAKSIFK